MGGVLTFEVNDVLKRIVEHTRKHGKCRVAYGEGEHTPEPSLFLVKDQGVYLMSASEKRLSGKNGKGNLVAYAREANPKFDDCWDSAREICGGDDFAENIDLSPFEEALASGAKSVEIKLSARSLEIAAYK